MSINAGYAQPLTVTAYDINGNVAVGYNGTVHITSSDPNAGLPGDVTLSGGTGGFDITLYKAGLDLVTATDSVDVQPHGH